MDKRLFFITGATGLVGTEVTERLLKETDSRIGVLVRAASKEDAERRLHTLWWGDEVLTSAIGERIVPIMGDLTKEGLGLNEESRMWLTEHATHLIHSAAETGVQKSKQELWRINVEGTRHVVELAKEMQQLTCFTHISTAYVAGTQQGLVLEDAPLGNSFFTLYERSKAEAEQVVKESSLPFIICRPGMVVGNTQTGRTRNFNTIYYVLKLVLLGKMRVLPTRPTQTVNVIPADEVARMVVAVSTNPDAIGKTFHLTPPQNQLPQVRELMEEVTAWAKDNLQVDVPRPIYLPTPFLRPLARSYNAGEKAKSHSILSNLTALMPYFTDDHEFDRTNSDTFTGQYQLDWHEYLPTLLAFACRHNFMRLSDKSIFEQALIRRSSKHYPITYYDITAKGMVRMTGKEMNTLIQHRMEQLQAMRVKAGDKVALAGINCTEHVAIDHAIGLVGATSVPIYYTTPAEEIELLLRTSGARWFYVGDERVKQNLGNLPNQVQVIFFGPLKSHKTYESYKSYESHKTHKSHESPEAQPPSLATIRFTSGTTGEPKGVMFSFEQLKWLGEVLTNLLSWKDRNTQMRYLSFLPMSHVVEGILAAYAPYCMLCDAKIYYLNDFQMLTHALPKVRPTVFFSVPRFFEKLWEQVELSPVGQKYLALKEGKLKTLTAKFLRWAVLRKAGLDKCSQLIVGSAPISEQLLLKFRALGIEIHNAYGQTEAPLITLNRLGDNVIPSIGTPLPDTEVSTNPDGELIVKGPQVALGYYQLESDTFQKGELHTGDLGHIGPDGHVFISGRKKDMLITSYGKNINCGKIEERLMDIPCVEHAVLVGEQRPYCTALLWLNSGKDTLQKDIVQMNAQLSHPEQVKRWKVMERPMSIKNGELTPNLKVKRNVVIAHHQQEIEEMYAAQ